MTLFERAYLIEDVVRTRLGGRVQGLTMKLKRLGEPIVVQQISWSARVSK